MTELKVEHRTQPATCDIHGDYIAEVFDLMGKDIIQKCPECSKIKDAEIAESRKREETYKEAEKIKTLFGKAAIPPRFKSKSFEDYVVTCDKGRTAFDICKGYALDFEKRLEAGGGLVLCGSPGTGKTHLAASIANHVIRAHAKSVIFISVISAMRKVKSTWSKNSDMTEAEALESFTRPDLLILDEVGVQFGSDAEKMILFEIINIRYQNMKPTILISNLPHNELNDYIGERVVDRMREGGGAIIPFDWDSYRSKL